MKKLVLTAAIVLGFTMGSFAQYFQSNINGGGLMGYGESQQQNRESTTTLFAPRHNQTGNQDANQVPVGGGALLLIGFGAAYAMSKKNKKD